MRSNGLDRFRAICGDVHTITILAQDRLHAEQDILFVVNDEDSRFRNNHGKRDPGGLHRQLRMDLMQNCGKVLVL